MQLFPYSREDIPVKDHATVLTTGIIMGLFLFLLLVSGCISQQPSDNNSQPTPAVTITPTDAPVTKTSEVVIKNSSADSVNPEGTRPKKLTLTVNSADRYPTIPGFNNLEGTAVAIINVSITNNLATDYRLERENIPIRTERDNALEHGGDRVSSDIARNFLRFPLSIHPGETKTGSIVYIVNTGRRTSNLVLTDSYSVTISSVDLNQIYQYH